jgi:hypothetical protein
MALYRKRAKAIQAIQFTGSNRDEVLAWGDENGGPLDASDSAIYVGTPGGILRAEAGSFVLSHDNGFFGVVGEAFFNEQYEEV